MRVEVSPQAATYVAEHGGSLWVWAERPGLCCNGTPAVMKARTSPPKDPTGFTTVAVPVGGTLLAGGSAVPGTPRTPRPRAPDGPEPPVAGIDVLFRAPGGRCPDVLEVAMRGRRNPKVEAYWDGCLLMM